MNSALLLTTIAENSFSSVHVETLALVNVLKSQVEDWQLVNN
jgi:hypothetical protein